MQLFIPTNFPNKIKNKNIHANVKQILKIMFVNIKKYLLYKVHVFLFYLLLLVLININYYSYLIGSKRAGVWPDVSDQRPPWKPATPEASKYVGQPLRDGGGVVI